MADRNFNQGNQSHQSGQDWERERNRYNQDSDWSQNRNRDQRYEGTGYSGNQGSKDVGYSGDSAHGMGNESQGNDNRVNYFPDNDDNRSYNSRDYENSQYGSSGTYGYRGNDRNDDWRRYGRENRGSFGNAGFGNDYGSSDWNRRRDYDDMYGNESDWNRRRMQSGGSWGSDNDRQDWGRGNVNSGYDSQRDYDNRYTGGDYGNRRNAYNRDWDRNRSRYGGDTSNYGNAKQGGVDNNWWDRTKDKVSSWFSDDDDDRRDRSRNYTGGHRGKGPSDYRRSEDRIREDICDRLTDDDRVDASNIRVQMENDAVILSGTVNSREEKRRAEDLVESISGVRNVENRLRVGGGGLASHDYTGNTDMTGGIGRESGTTNEIIRNVEKERNPGSTTGRNKSV